MKSDANRILIILSMKYFWRSSFISFRCVGEDEEFGDISAGSSQTLLTFGSLDLQVTVQFDKEMKQMFLLESSFKKGRGNRKFGCHFMKDFLRFFSLMKPTKKMFLDREGGGKAELVMRDIN